MFSSRVSPECATPSATDAHTGSAGVLSRQGGSTLPGGPLPRASKAVVQFSQKRSRPSIAGSSCSPSQTFQRWFVGGERKGT
jgi:hypothetical protein